MRDLSSLGSDSSGVWTRPQALAHLTAGQIDALVRAGTWQVPWRGVYADGGYILDAHQRAWAAVLAVGGAGRPATAAADAAPGRRQLRAVARGRTAARVWGLPLVDDHDPATGADEHRLDDVAIGRQLPAQSYGGRTLLPFEQPLRRTGAVRLASGLWVTDPLHTLVDCARLLTSEALICATDAALHRKLIGLAELDAAAAVRRGRPGAMALRDAAARADGRSESPLETLTRLLLLPALPGLEPQVELFDRAARLVACFDLGDRRVRLAVEGDGKAGHAGDAMVARDRRRDRRAQEFGWHTERVTWYEVRRQQSALVRRITEVHASLFARRTVA